MKRVIIEKIYFETLEEIQQLPDGTKIKHIKDDPKTAYRIKQSDGIYNYDPYNYGFGNHPHSRVCWKNLHLFKPSDFYIEVETQTEKVEIKDLHFTIKVV